MSDHISITDHFEVKFGLDGTKPIVIIIDTDIDGSRRYLADEDAVEFMKVVQKAYKTRLDV